MNTQRRVPDIELERIALNELSPDHREAVLERLRAEPGGMERLDALMASNEDILEQYPPHLMATQIKEKAQTSKSKQTSNKRNWMFVLPAVSAAAAVLFVLVLHPGANSQFTTAPQSDEIILLKGDTSPALFVFRKGKGSEDDILKTGEKAGAGDVLQLKYAARGARHGVIFSVDGRGSVTLHFPGKPDGSTALEKGGAHALGFSYELDDAPKFERFFFVTAENRLETEEILVAGRKLKSDRSAKLELPDFVTVVEFLLIKDNGN